MEKTKENKIFWLLMTGGVFLAILILIAPYLNNNIYARSKGITNGGSSFDAKDDVENEFEDDFSGLFSNKNGESSSWENGNSGSNSREDGSRTQEAYDSLQRQLTQVPGQQFDISLTEFFIEQVEPETTDHEISKEERPENKKIYKFHGDRAFKNDVAEKRMRLIQSGEASYTWEDLRKDEYVGVVCSGRGIYLTSAAEQAFGAYRAKLKQDRVNEIYQKILDLFYSGRLKPQTSEIGKKKYKQTIFIDEDNRENFRPKATQMIFKGFKNNSGPGVKRYLDFLKEKTGMKYTIDGEGNAIIDREEYERIKEKYGNSDIDAIGDFLVEDKWEFIDDETIDDNMYDTSRGYIATVEIEKRQNGEEWLQFGLKSNQITLPAGYEIKKIVDLPETNIELLNETEPHAMGYIQSDFASPFGGYPIAAEVPQNREADEEGKAPYKYEKGIRPDGFISAKLDDNRNGLQGLWWQIADGLRAYTLLGMDPYEIPFLGDFSAQIWGINNKGNKISNITEDAQSWRKSWLEFMKYIEKNKDKKPSKKQRTYYIKYKNGKAVEGVKSPKPFEFTFSDYFDEGLKHNVLQYPENLGKYNPMFVEVDGKKPEDQRDVQMKRDESIWQIGPYKLEYFQNQMDPLISPITQKQNQDGKGPWFADLVGAKLNGRYRKFPNGENDNSNHLLDYDRNTELPQNNKINKEQMAKVRDNINQMTDAANDLLEVFNRTGKNKELYDNVSKKIEEIVKKLYNGQGFTGNDLLELENLIKMLKDSTNQNRSEFSNNDLNKLNNAFKNLEDGFNKLKETVKGTGIETNTENIRRLQENMGNNSGEQVTPLEIFEFINKVYGYDLNNPNNFAARLGKYITNATPANVGRGKMWNYATAMVKLDSTFKALYNKVQSGSELTQNDIKNIQDSINEVKSSLRGVVEVERKYRDNKINNMSLQEYLKMLNENPNFLTKYTPYTFSDLEFTRRRTNALNRPNIEFTDIFTYDMNLLFSAINKLKNGNEDENSKNRSEEYQKAYREYELDKAAGIYGRGDHSKQPQYEEGQILRPKGEFEKSEQEIPHDKRKDTSQLTDRHKEYKEEDEYTWNSRIIEDNDTSKLENKNLVNSLENMQGVYNGLVGQVPVSTDAEKLFPLSKDQLDMDIADKRGSKSNPLLYGGIYTDLLMLIKDNEIMQEEGRSSFDEGQLKNFKDHLLIDQIAPRFEGLGGDGGAPGAANTARGFIDLAKEGGSLGIPGFRTDDYIFSAKETSLSTKLWGSSHEYRNGTDVEDKRRKVGKELSIIQQGEIRDAIAVTAKEIDRVENEITNLIDEIAYKKSYLSTNCDVLDTCYRTVKVPCSDDSEKTCEETESYSCCRSSCDACKSRKARYRSEIPGDEAELKQLEIRLKTLKNFLKSLKSYNGEYNGEYPQLFGNASNIRKNYKLALNEVLNKTKKYAVSKINLTIKENNKVKYKNELKLAFEKEKEFEKKSKLLLAKLDNEIKEMGYTVNNAKKIDFKDPASEGEGGDGQSKVKEIKNWKFLIVGRDPVEGEPYLPNPGEEFYYIVKHDPELMDITSASFDFAYMVTNSRFIYYTGSQKTLTALKAETEEKIDDMVNLGGAVTMNFDKKMTPILKADVEEIHAQPLAMVESGVWINFMRIELQPSLKPTPPTPGINVGAETNDFGIRTPGQTGNSGFDNQRDAETPGHSGGGGSHQDKDHGGDETPGDTDKKVMARLYIPIAGRVFIDEKSGRKHLAYNHKYDEGEAKDLDGVFKVDVRRVAVKTKDSGDKVVIEKVLWKEKARLFKPGTFDKINGDEIYTDAEGKWGTFNLHDISFSEKEFEKLSGMGISPQQAAVVFEVVYSYDGLQFTDVLPLQKDGYNFDTKIDLDQLVEAYKNSPNEFKDASQAVENRHIRNDFNRRFAEMEGGVPYDAPEGVTGGKIYGDISGTHANSVKHGSNERIGAVQLEYEQNGPEDGGIYGTSKLIWYKAKDMFNGEDFKKARTMQASTVNLNLPIPIHKNIHIPAESLESLASGSGDKTQTIESGNQKVTLPWYNSSQINYYNVEPYMKNITFGVKERERVRLKTSKDLLSASLFIKNKAINYVFDEGFDMEAATIPSIKLDADKIADQENHLKMLDSEKVSNEVANKNGQGNEYKLDLYKADYLYRTAMYSTKMMEPADMGALNNKKDIIKDAFGSYQNYAQEIYNQMYSDMQTEFSNGGDSKEQGGIEDTRQLDIFLTYKVTVANESADDDVVITELRDQYNPKYMQEVKQDIRKFVQENPSEYHKAYGKTAMTPITMPRTRLAKARISEETKMVDAKGDPEKHIWSGDESIDSPGARKAFVNSKNEVGIKLEKGNKVDIYTVYRLRRIGSGIDGLGVNLPNSIYAADDLHQTDKVLGNIVEIGSFASYKKGTDVLTARVENTSAPGTVPNLDFQSDITRIEDYYNYDKTKLEGDTGFAPGLRMEVNQELDSRRINGIAWEDSRNKGVDVSLTGKNVAEGKTAKMYVGDGIKQPEEQPLKGQKIVLEERIPVSMSDGIGATINGKIPNNANLDPGSEYLDVPFIWPSEVELGNGERINLETELGLRSVQNTEADGKYNFLGVPAGNFVIKTPYTSQKAGMDADNPPEIEVSDLVPTSEQERRTIKWINGVDFKSTFYRMNGEDNLNETWLPKLRSGETDLSYIRDDEYRRLELMKAVKNLNNNLHVALESMDVMNPNPNDVKLIHDNGRMIATTPKMAFSVENLEKLDQTGEIIKDPYELNNLAGMYEGTTFLKGTTSVDEKNYPEEYAVDDVNAGIIQRPISKMELRKDITNLSLTTNSGSKVIDLHFDIEYGNPENDEITEGIQSIYEPYVGAMDMSSKLNEEKSEGFENVMVLNTLYGNRFSTKPIDDSGAQSYKQGFIYINMDEQLMQGSTIKSEYIIRAVNLSEPDLYDEELEKLLESKELNDPLFSQKIKPYYSGPLAESEKLNHEALSEYNYGNYLNKHYYKPEDLTNLNIDQIEKVKFEEIMDVIDNKCEYDEQAFVARPEQKDAQWKKGIKRDLVNKLSDHRLGNTANDTGDMLTKKAAEINLVDENGVAYLDDKRSNIYISSKTKEETKETLPLALYVGQPKEEAIENSLDKWYIGTKKYIASLAEEKDLSFDNTAELLQYSVSSGKRLRGIRTGDIFTDDGTHKYEEELRKLGSSKLFARSIFQKDSFTTEKISLTPPTGLKLLDKLRSRKTIITSIGLLAIATVAIYSRKRYVNSINTKEMSKNKTKN